MPWKQIAATSVIGVVLFSFGWAFGSGRVELFWQQSGTQSADLPADFNYQQVEEVYDVLKNKYDGKLTTEQVQDGLKKGLAQAAEDPYTEYLTEAENEEFDAELSGSFTGIGAELSKEEDQIVVVAPIAGYPAEKAGLRGKDVIVEIDGKSTYNMSLSDAVKRIRGPKDTIVTLKVIRDGQKEVVLEITRDNINIPSVEHEIKDGNIGYIKISRFGDDTVALAQAAATEFKQKNVSGIVVDVRNDPGGLLSASVDVASLWLPEGTTVLSERRGETTIKTYTASNGAPLKGIPTVVLINEGSASASEILAGALKDNEAAQLLGAKTYGKGSVQQLQNLRYGGALKVTVARWYTPQGKNIDKEGIKPDTEVKITDEDLAAKRDPQLDAALRALQR